jgi:membrane associated rhomboid family serine protease
LPCCGGKRYCCSCFHFVSVCSCVGSCSYLIIIIEHVSAHEAWNGVVFPWGLLHIWAELTTPKLGGAYSQQPSLVQFSFWKLCVVLYCMKDCTQLLWLLRISTAKFLHAKFGKIFENKITNIYMWCLLNPLP